MAKKFEYTNNISLGSVLTMLTIISIIGGAALKYSSDQQVQNIEIALLKQNQQLTHSSIFTQIESLKSVMDKHFEEQKRIRINNNLVSQKR